MINKKFLLFLLLISILILGINCISATNDTVADTVNVDEDIDNNVADTVNVDEDVGDITSTNSKEDVITVDEDNGGNEVKNSEVGIDSKSVSTKYSNTNKCLTSKPVKITSKNSKTIVSAPKVYVYYKHNNLFKITVKDSFGDFISNLKLKVRIYTGKSFKAYILKTNYKGIATFNTKHLKIGVHPVIITSSSSKYKVNRASKIIVKKFNIRTVIMKIKKANYYSIQKRIYKRDYITLGYESRVGMQADPGIWVYATYGKALNNAKNIKITKFVAYYKNNDGKIITRTTYKGKTPKIDGYYPFKVKIWYKIK